MDSTIELVQLWATFQDQYPGSSIDDFCRHRLAVSKERTRPERMTAGLNMPIHLEGLVMRLIGRVSKISMSFAKVGLQELGLTQMEEFGLLLSIVQLKDPKKSEVIFANLLELSSGTDMVNRLIDKKLVVEIDDQEDKRSKRLQITAKGLKLMKECMTPVSSVSGTMLSVLSKEDKELMLQLLHEVESRFSKLVPVAKGKPFEEALKELKQTSGKEGKKANEGAI